jgi:hypothetical protein
MSSGLTIQLFNPGAALLKDSSMSPTTPELQYKSAPFTYSPLRGGKTHVGQKSCTQVRDASKKDAKIKKTLQ